jgi:hypothetical protein
MGKYGRRYYTTETSEISGHASGEAESLEPGCGMFGEVLQIPYTGTKQVDSRVGTTRREISLIFNQCYKGNAI